MRDTSAAKKIFFALYISRRGFVLEAKKCCFSYLGEEYRAERPRNTNGCEVSVGAGLRAFMDYFSGVLLTEVLH
jgi:hypothetical protein